ncbi:MAG: YIP1 family protein [bacterium]
MSGVETIYYTFTKPAVSMKALQGQKPVSWAFFVVLLATISSHVGGILISPVELNVAKVILTVGLLGRLIFIIGIWIVGTAIFHLFAEWFDGEGKVSSLFTALGFCFLPAILITPWSLLIQNTPHAIKFSLYLLFNLIILLWIVKLEIISIREIYQVSNFRAVMILTTPATLIILAVFILILLALVLSFSIIPASFPHSLF